MTEPRSLGNVMYSLSDQVAIVTGSARGIGRSTAEQLASAGARVLTSAMDGPALKEATDRLNGRAVAFCGDLTQPGLTEELVQRAIDEWGRLDVVVNNAGYNWDSPMQQMSNEQFQAMIDIHLSVPFRILRAAAPHMLGAAKAERERREERFRKVVNISSVSGTMGNPNQANYSAAKAGLIGLTKGLAKEWGEWKINVNAVAPGFVETRLTALEDEGEIITRHGRPLRLGIPESHLRKGTDLVPLGRPGRPEEVATAVLFLCSPASNYVHGQVLGVTGGLTLGMSA